MSAACRAAPALPLLFLLLLTAVPCLADQPLVCEICGKPITGRYLEEAGHAYHEACYAEAKAPRCAVCGKAILGPRIDYEGKSYHEACYRDAVQPHCAICGKPIEGSYVVEDGKNYHPACRRSQSARCVICSQPLEGSILADSWGNPFHARHGSKVLCPFCGRAMSPSTTGGSVVSAANGMRICALCNRRGVESRGSAENLLERTRLQLLDTFPVPSASFTWELVSQAELARMLPPSRQAGAELGLTREERLRRGRNEALKVQVYLLSGVPDWLFTAVCAHELAHVWQYQQGLDDLPLEKAEGSAELAAFLVLRRGGTDEGRIKIHGMEESPDPAYGAGFRKALEVSMKGDALAALRRALTEGSGWPRTP
jgi:hypothetical protein